MIWKGIQIKNVRRSDAGCVACTPARPKKCGRMKMSGIMICVTGVVVIVAASLAAGSVLYLLQRKNEKLKSEQINL